MTLAELEQGKAASLAEIAAAASPEDVERLRVKYVGRNGSIPALIKGMKDVPKEDRPAFGKAVQAWKAEVEAALAVKGAGAGPAAAAAGDIDASMPGRWAEPGVEHPLSRVIAESAQIRDTVLSKMCELRVACDEAETLTARSYWPFPTYGDILFSVK